MVLVDVTLDIAGQPLSVCLVEQHFGLSLARTDGSRRTCLSKIIAQGGRRNRCRLIGDNQ